MTLSVDDKLRVARRMDELGVAYIEGGWPGANPKDTEFFRRAADGELDLDRHPGGVRHDPRGRPRAPRTTRRSRRWSTARTDVVCLVGKSWGYHVDEALRVPRDENLAMVRDSIGHLHQPRQAGLLRRRALLRRAGRDGAYARDVVRAAAEAGAECVVLCDTNGGAMPWDVLEIVRGLVRDLPCDVGLHFHDDGGCAVANSMLGIEAGAVHVQGTANGLGERCGNANLFTIMADLQLKRRLPLDPPRPARAAHRDQPHRRRAVQPVHPGRGALRRATPPSATRPGCTPRRWPRRPTCTSTSTRTRSATVSAWWSASSPVAATSC